MQIKTTDQDPSRREILKGKEIGRTVERLAYEILDRCGECENLAIVGVQRRGVDLAARIKKLLDAKLGRAIPLGKLDINLYRDDWTSLDVQPLINDTDLPFTVEHAHILLIDDVLYTGRTVRAALEALMDFGRPKRIELLVLVDRGHRELPIHADYVGRHVETLKGQRVDVYLKEHDGKDLVRLSS